MEREHFKDEKSQCYTALVEGFSETLCSKWRTIFEH